MTTIHWFTGKEDCEAFFTQIAKNNNQELTPYFIVEGNNEIRYWWFVAVAELIGWNNIGIQEKYYNHSEDYDCLDEVFLNVKGNGDKLWDDDGKRVWLKADEVSIESNGTIRIWWD